MSEATTLDRLSYILKSAKGIVNAEDEPYIAASLGCANGIMRSPGEQRTRIRGRSFARERSGGAAANKIKNSMVNFGENSMIPMQSGTSNSSIWV